MRISYPLTRLSNEALFRLISLGNIHQSQTRAQGHDDSKNTETYAAKVLFDFTETSLLFLSLWIIRLLD